MNVIKRNLGYLLFSQALLWVTSIAVLLIAPRQLGDSAFGELTFAMVYVSFFSLVAEFGTGTYIVKSIARDTSEVGRYVANAVAMKIVVSIALSGLALGLAKLIGYNQDTLELIAAYCIGMVLNSMITALGGGLHGLQEMRKPAISDVARNIVASVIGLTVIWNGGSLLAYALVINLAMLIPVAVMLHELWPRLRGHLRMDLGLWRLMTVGGVPFFIWAALLTFYGTIDIPLLRAFAGSDAVGDYFLAYRWVSMPAFFAASVATAFFPALSNQSIGVRDEFVRLANRALRLVFFVATPAAVGIALIADPFISQLYGPEFQQAIPLMRILALHVPIVGLDIVLGSVVVAADKQRLWVLVGVVAAIINPLLNLGAIPLSQNLFGNAAIGAAVITVVTEFVLLVGAILLRPAGVLDRATTRMLVRITLASATMAPVVLALGSQPLAVQIIAGAVAFGLASLALGTISLRELRGFGLGTLRRQSTGATP